MNGSFRPFTGYLQSLAVVFPDELGKPDEALVLSREVLAFVLIPCALNSGIQNELIAHANRFQSLLTRIRNYLSFFINYDIRYKYHPRDWLEVL